MLGIGGYVKNGFRRKPRDYAYKADGLSIKGKNLDFLSCPEFESAWSKAVAGNLAAWNGKVPDIRYRAYICCWAARQALALEGDFVECGVFTGLLSMTVCHYLKFNEQRQKNFFLFDTFYGIPTDNLLEDEIEQADHKNELLYNFDYYDISKSNFAPFHNANLVKGRVPETFSSVPLEKISYLSIDMNNASAEMAAVEVLWPRITPGGITILDDYAFSGYEAQKRAWDEFSANNRANILTLPTGQGLIIKSS